MKSRICGSEALLTVEIESIILVEYDRGLSINMVDPTVRLLKPFRWSLRICTSVSLSRVGRVHTYHISAFKSQVR